MIIIFKKNIYLKKLLQQICAVHFTMVMSKWTAMHACKHGLNFEIAKQKMARQVFKIQSIRGHSKQYLDYEFLQNWSSVVAPENCLQV